MKTKAQKLGITEFPYIEYDANGNCTYHENSNGSWCKREYDANGRRTYYENSDGYREGTPRKEFDDAKTKLERENAELREHLKIAVHWMHKVNNYSPPRMQDMWRMSEVVFRIDEAMKGTQ